MDAFDQEETDREMRDRLRKEGKVTKIPPEDPDVVRARDLWTVGEVIGSSARPGSGAFAEDDVEEGYFADMAEDDYGEESNP